MQGRHAGGGIEDCRRSIKGLAHPVNEYLIPGRRRGCSPVKALGFAEHLRSYASLFAGEHEPVTTAIPSGEEQSTSFETAGEQVLIPWMNPTFYLLLLISTDSEDGK